MDTVSGDDKPVVVGDQDMVLCHIAAFEYQDGACGAPGETSSILYR